MENNLSENNLSKKNLSGKNLSKKDLRKKLFATVLVLTLLLTGCGAKTNVVSEPIESTPTPSPTSSQEARPQPSSAQSEEPSPSSLTEESKQMPEESEEIDMLSLAGTRWEYRYSTPQEPNMVTVLSFEPDDQMMYINGVYSSGAALFGHGQYTVEGNIIKTEGLYDDRVPDVVYKGSFSIEIIEDGIRITYIDGMPFFPGAEDPNPSESVLFTLQG